MRRRASVWLAVLAVLPMLSCSHGGSGHDDLVLTVRGAAEVTSSLPVVRLATGRHKLVVGQTVRVTRGTAVLGLPGNGTLELRARRTVGPSSDDSTLTLAATPILVDGDALVVTRDSRVRLASGGATFAVRGGEARVRRSSGVTLAVYGGRATVSALGRTLPRPVTAFRQVAIADTGALPRRAVPLVFDRRHPDPWDLRYLGDAMDLGEQLERRSLALSGTLRPPSVPDATFLASVVPALRQAPGFGDSLVDPTRSVGETVVGASIALGAPGALVSRWNAAFSFRSQGADWGLVAADQRARRSSLFGVLDGVLDGVVAAGPTPSVGPRPSRPSGQPSPSPSPSTPPTTTPTTPPPGGPPTTLPPLPPETGPLGGLLGGLLGSRSVQGPVVAVNGVLGTAMAAVGARDGPTG